MRQNLVYPPKGLAPPMQGGYNYTNTGYILLSMIAEKASGEPYSLLLNNLIKKAGLKDTFYPVPKMDEGVKQRMVHGYSFNLYENPELLGRDVSNNNLSWGAAAGGIVSNSADIIHWVEGLFISNKILDNGQKKQLGSLVSFATGKHIVQVTAKDPKGFGLGVVQQYVPSIGRFWFYEGSTLGFRSVYIYVPSTGIIISAAVNSAVYSGTDKIGGLIENLYEAVLSSGGMRRK